MLAFGRALHRLTYLQPTERGDGEAFDFLVSGPWYDPVLTAH